MGFQDCFAIITRPITLIFSLLIATSSSAVRQIRASSQGTAAVDIGQTHGSATFLASGFIYGWPDNGTSASTQIPDHLVTGFNFNASRAGRAQLPVRGWATGGLSGYTERFQSALSNYRTTRKYGESLSSCLMICGVQMAARAQRRHSQVTMGIGLRWRLLVPSDGRSRVK